MKRQTETDNNVMGRKRTSKQMCLSIAMVIVSLVVLSVTTYAWFLITNTPKVKKLGLNADTLGDLKIADVKVQNNVQKPGSYGDEIDLSGVTMDNLYLSPCTTKDGKAFFKPVYTEGQVTGVEQITDTVQLHKKYVYEKDFYLKAGGKAETGREKDFDIFFVGYSTKSGSGTYVNDKDSDKITASNAIRISFTFTEGNKKPVTVIYEPNCDMDNGGITESGASGSQTANMADFVMSSPDAQEYGTKGEKYGTKTPKEKGYSTIKQNHNRHSFVPDSGNETRSTSLVTIKEGKDIHVTMRVWLEGTDKDCMDGVAADKLVSQIQFISEEHLN